MSSDRIIVLCVLCVSLLTSSAAAQAAKAPAVRLQDLFPNLRPVATDSASSKGDSVAGDWVPPGLQGLYWIGTESAVALRAEIRAAERRSLRLMIVRLIAADVEPDKLHKLATRLVDLEGEIDWDDILASAEYNRNEIVRLIVLDAVLAAEERAATSNVGQAVRAAADDPVVVAYRDFLISRLHHEKDMLGESSRVIRFTNWISWFIFAVTHVILGIGVWAAVREFIHASRMRHEAPHVQPLSSLKSIEDTDAPQGNSMQARMALAEQEIRVSLEGVALKTTLHGVILFAMAIGFYVLYLKFVYPITVVGQ